MGKDGECGRGDWKESIEDSVGSGWGEWSHSGGKWEGNQSTEAGGWLVEFRFDCWVNQVRYDFLPFAVAACSAPKWKPSHATRPHMH